MVEAKEAVLVNNASDKIENFIKDKLTTLLWKKLLQQTGKIMEVKNL